jgi:coenzyme F420 hydrogenase subunit beta
MKTKGRNIDFVYKNNLCHFCGTCYGVCPKENIDVVFSEAGNPIFKVANVEECGRCDLCYSVCPGHEVDFEKLHENIFSRAYEFTWLGFFERCFLAHSRDDEVRLKGASGGAVSSLLITALEAGKIDGALVVRMAGNCDPLKTETYIARSREDILRANSSKYITVSLNMYFRKILKMDKEEKYVLVGLPCHIHGLRKAQNFIPKLRRRVVLCIAIFCGRGTCPLGTEYVLKKLNVKKSDVAEIAYRKGKWPGNFAVTLKTGEERCLPLNDYVYIMKMFQNVRCGLCSDHTGELADISAGDAWLQELSGQDGWNILMARTKAGEDLIIEASNSKNLEISTVEPYKVKLSQKLVLYDKKQNIFSMMNIAEFFGLKNTIPKYTGLKYPERLTFHDYFRALIFFVVPRVTAIKSLRFLLTFLLKLPLKFLRMDFGIKQRVVSEKVMKDSS